MMVSEDKMELLRLRVGIGSRTLGEARWAIAMRRQSDNYGTILMLGEHGGTRVGLIKDYLVSSEHKSLKASASQFGGDKEGVRVTCERVCVAWNYAEPELDRSSGG